MSIFNNLLKISLLGTIALIPYVSAEGISTPVKAKISTSDEVAILGSQRREERRDNRQERREERRDNRQERRDERRGTDEQQYDQSSGQQMQQTTPQTQPAPAPVKDNPKE